MVCGEVQVCVLVVDDEALIRWSVGTALTEAGYSVVEASTGAEAHERAVGHRRVDFAVLDVRLPDADGVAVMRDIRKVHPACRFLFMTAFRTPELVHTVEGEDIPIMDKPFSLPELVHAVQTRLDHPGPSPGPGLR